MDIPILTDTVDLNYKLAEEKKENQKLKSRIYRLEKKLEKYNQIKDENNIYKQNNDSLRQKLETFTK